MVSVICKKCSSTGFSASTSTLCECGGKCREMKTKKGGVQYQAKAREINIVSFHWNRLYRVLFNKIG